MASNTDPPWRWLIQWRPGKRFGHGSPVPAPSLTDGNDQEWEMPHWQTWGCLRRRELGSRNAHSSPIRLITPNGMLNHLRKKIIFEMQVEAIREMQIQATVQIHFTTFTHTRMAAIKKTDNNKYYWWGCGETRTLLYSCWECKIMQLLWKTVCQFLEI